MAPRTPSAARSASLPPGRQFALTWGIAEPFGGMTTALLERSRLFAAAGSPVDVLTLDDRAVPLGPAFAAWADAGVRVRNLYDWARSGDVAAAGSPPPTPELLAGGDVVEDVHDGVLLRRLRLGDDGKPVDVDHLRADGAVAMTERRRGKKRMLIAHDASGIPVRAWRRRYDLYAAWLDHLTGGRESFLLVDSKTVAPFAADYHGRRVTTVHIVHGSHRGPTPGSVRASRQPVFGRLGAFDAVAFATRTQRDDVRALVGRRPLLTTVAHPVGEAAAASVVADEERSGAVVIARLEPIKRVADAIEAVARRNRDAAEPLPLDVYGSGSQAEALAAAAAKAAEPSAADGRSGRHDDAIQLRGHTDDPAGVLAAADVLLLTSRSEAFGLVLLEAMAAGCLPIAYDVPYGPADLIRSGENGWLVPDGDIDALAEALRTAGELDPAARATMRQNARRTAAEYSPERILRRWSVVLRAARRRQVLLAAVRLLARAVRGGLRRLRRLR
ncbi:glycosyltransferase [Microbacterium radiodurans]|uniref:Glycosyltransferase n=1 Tax=Microbacterium radiodurans TaxID=661398 RepID=A0A5J5IV13_9MICO|nr:glycosyltransferase [Microbacterium radiodurans]KAA9089707.1 glycosyltransferase [Microbacterium radiodurans]